MTRQSQTFRKTDSKSSPRQWTFIDLFCGCGGFSLGLQSDALVCRAAIDFDAAAVETFRVNHPHVPHVLHRDLTAFRPKHLDKFLCSERIDIIVGGPPCQGFSKARQVDGGNHGKRLIHDSRRDLYEEFLRYVKYFQPSIFVMENVLGIRSAAGGEFFTRVQVESRELGYRVIPYEADAWRFGVPQKRIRQLIIGTRRELPLFIPDKYIQPTHALQGEKHADRLQPFVTLDEAIGDLPPIAAGEEHFVLKYDLRRRSSHIAKYGGRYIEDVLKVRQADTLTGHMARPHSDRDLRDFARLQEGENSRQAIVRGEAMEFPYDRENFKDRFTRQHRNELCSTIVAHLKKDGLMFIHPTQPRSLTPREAARIQSFPDTFVLPESRTASFGQVGNAVPPLIGRAMGHAIVEYLRTAPASDTAALTQSGNTPKSRRSAIGLLEEFVDSLYLRFLSDVPRTEFLRAWWAVGYLHPNLHPDAAVENGRELSPGPRRGISCVIEPFYVRSGWPVELIPIAHEARRRFENGQISEGDYYCSSAIVAGAVGRRGKVGEPKANYDREAK